MSDCPHIRHSAEGTNWCDLAESTAADLHSAREDCVVLRRLLKTVVPLAEAEALALALEAACVALQNQAIVAPYEGFMEREIKQAQEARNRWREKHPHWI